VLINVTGIDIELKENYYTRKKSIFITHFY